MLPCKDNSLATEDDSVLSDAYEYHYKRRVGLAIPCRDSVRYQVSYFPERRPIALHQRNSSRDYDPAPVCLPVLAGILCEAKPTKEIHVIFKKISYKLYNIDRIKKQ